MQISIGEGQEVSITFNLAGLEMLRLCSNGDIFVKGILTARSTAAVKAFKEFALGLATNKGTVERHETLIKRG